MKTKRYEYLVSYSFQGGNGRSFITWPNPLNSAERVIEVEKMLMENEGREHLPRLIANNIVLLRKWSE
jgi:hypothetical protein